VTVPAPNPNTENRGKIASLNTLGDLWLPPGCPQIALLINVSPRCEQGYNFAYRLNRQAKMVRETPFLPGCAWAVIIQKSQLWTRPEDIQIQAPSSLTRLATQLEAAAKVVAGCTPFAWRECRFYKPLAGRPGGERERFIAIPADDWP